MPVKINQLLFVPENPDIPVPAPLAFQATNNRVIVQTSHRPCPGTALPGYFFEIMYERERACSVGLHVVK